MVDMTHGDGGPPADSGARTLRTRSLDRESARAERLLATGGWLPAPADAEAATRVLARLTAPLPVRRTASERTRTADRDRRLQRVLRSAVHHLDAGAVGAPTAALLAAVARALLPWHAAPNPPAAAAAPRYDTPPKPNGAAHAPGRPPTDAGEALLPRLSSLFASLAEAAPAGAASAAPPVEPWSVRYAGRFRHYGRPAPQVWTARTFHCPGCAGADGPWTVTCDWRLVTLVCVCGSVSDDHGLAFSEVWLLLPDG
ncbi:hypothetical protein [Streptomyces fructofermentans]|uniref:Uncharacterized protein n=1 Tax=Streptomyces fructofermentans TaxID=152141 RepID=A0A918NCW3_9ACTN|nr:hypothetical protein [Streptomyces fructofermentans]GGX63161.1 hypothetical protein GCM10010515_33530 [Streptomyces fructofermentans]